MTTTVELIYEQGVLRPVTALAFLEGAHVTATLTDMSVSQATDAAYLLTLPRAERNRILAQAAESAAPEYEADLALPAAERELTAFTALDGELFVDGEEVESPHAS